MLQEKCNHQENLGVCKCLRISSFCQITEFVLPGKYLLAAFADVVCCNNPLPSLMADVDSTLQFITQWKHLVTTNLTSAFCQIPLSQVSMPFKGFQVCVCSAMGMPGSGTALEGLMCCILGHLQQDGVAAKSCLSCCRTGRRSTRPSTNATYAFHNNQVDLELWDLKSQSILCLHPCFLF